MIKSKQNLIKRTLTLMVWKRTSKATKKISLKKKKKILNNGKNGRKLKRREFKSSNKKSRVLELKMIKFGRTLTNKKKLIGNKNITLIGLNGKWKLKAERSMKLKEKRRDKSTKRKKSNTNKKKSLKNTLEKLSYVTSWSHIWTPSKKTGIELIKPVKTKKNKLLMLVLKSQLILNGKIKKLRSFNLKNLRLRRKLQRKVERRIKTETKIKKKNKKFSIFLTTFKTNSNHWKF